MDQRGERRKSFLTFNVRTQEFKYPCKVWVQFISVPRVKSPLRIARREGGGTNSKSTEYATVECTPSLLPKLFHFSQVTTSLRRILNRNPPRASTLLFVPLLSILQEQEGVWQAPSLWQTYSADSKSSAAKLYLVPFYK